MARRALSSRARGGVHPLHARHDAAWRDPAEVASLWPHTGTIDGRLLHHTVRGAWWETLAAHGLTLLVSREYEHLLMAMRADRRGPAVTYMPLPHPSGVAIDQTRGIVHVASTRNPNQVYDFMPATALAGGTNGARRVEEQRPLVPVRSRFLPGSLYLHDLALIGGRLHANAVGQNAVVRLDPDGRYERVWWPRCIETPSGPVFHQNHLQLNSIAAGSDLPSSYFSASNAALSTRRPGHRNFSVEGRGVIFSGASREPVVRGLTRPHSARLWEGRVWVDDSGFGTVGVVEGGKYTMVARLPGWTRGLCFHQGVAFVGTSRVLPRFRHYAPGLDVAASRCAVHAVDIASGKVLGSLVWPYGNQIFAVDWMPTAFSSGFVFGARSRRPTTREAQLFYAFLTDLVRE
jgi:uncharacterized protein (TIGR03032 family)